MPQTISLRYVSINTMNIALGKQDLLKNTGIIPPDDSNPNEYKFGSLSGIIHEDRLTHGDWRNHTPTDEKQKYWNFDTFGCVSFSCLNSIEMQLKWMLDSGLMRKEDHEWLKYNGYVDENGHFNFDDRWLVLLSGTKPGVGNYIHKVWDAARKYGLAPHNLVPFDENWSQKQYYDKSDFPKEAYRLGLEFLKRFIIQYERVTPVTDENLLKAHKHAPVQIGVATCEGWTSLNAIKWCGRNANHATISVLRDDLITYVYDSYKPFNKRLSADYKIPFAYKGVIYPVTPVSGEREAFVFKKNLTLGCRDNDVVQLCKILIWKKCLPSDKAPTPHYNKRVAEGVLAYQTKYRCVSWWTRLWDQGGKFDSETRKHMNKYSTGPNYPW